MRKIWWNLISEQVQTRPEVAFHRLRQIKPEML
jgi:hypothetical protein